MSFPSEHSATAFAVFGVMALWDFFRLKKIEKYGAEALAVPLMILLLPFVVALSRSKDHRHHSGDVITGILIGCTASLGCYFFYFPRHAGKRQPGRASSHAETALAHSVSVDVNYGTESDHEIVPLSEERLPNTD